MVKSSLKAPHAPAKAPPQRWIVCLLFHFVYIVIPTTFTFLPMYLAIYGNSTSRTVGLGWIMAYLVWAIVSNRDTMSGHGRPWPWLQNLPMWSYIFSYFPVFNINCTMPLDPNKTYIFGAHPHGTLATNRALFGFDIDELWHKSFPGIDFRVLTATAALRVPVIRELWMWTHCIDANKSTARRTLERGTSLLVYPGGEREQMMTVKGANKLFLLSRKGFVKLAIEQAASLVPIYIFGETDLFTHHQWGIGARLWMVRNLGIALPLISGKLGLLAYRAPVTAVSGAPIATTTTDDVDEVHARYVQAVRDLFEKHKAEYGCKDAVLEIM